LQGSPEMLRILFAPRSTMRWILNHDPNYGVSMIAMSAGITAALRASILHGLHPLPDLMGLFPLLDEVVAYGIGPSAGLFLSVATIAIYGSVIGVFAVWVGALVMWLIGRLVGGQGRYQAVRASLAWAFVPYTWILPAWLIYAVLNVEPLRAASFNYGALMPWELPSGLAILLGVDYLLRIIGFVWAGLKLSVALNTSLTKSFIIAIIVILPPILVFAPWQGFGF